MDLSTESREIPIDFCDQTLILFFSLDLQATADNGDGSFLGLSCELCFKDKGKSASSLSGELMLLLNFTWCFMSLVHYLMKIMMR